MRVRDFGGGRMLVAALVAGLLVPMGPARAGGLKCEWTEATKTLTFRLDEFYRAVTIVVSGGDSVGYRVSDTTGTCGVSTLNEMDRIRILDPINETPATAIISLTGGPFAPGFTDEAGDSDEIEFLINLGGGENMLGIEGASAESNNIRMGTTKLGSGDNIRLQPEVNLNAGEAEGIDQDVVVKKQLAGVIAQGGELADAIGAHGGAATGGVFQTPVLFDGHSGRDSLTGGAKRDWIDGGEVCDTEKTTCTDDADVISGGASNDVITGGSARDKLNGGDGRDLLQGGDGNDVLKGQAGGDWLEGQAGDDSLDGGTGEDDCDGGTGSNSLANCEG